MNKFLLCLLIIASLAGCRPSLTSKSEVTGKDGLYLLAPLPDGQPPLQFKERLIALDEDTRDSLMYVNHLQGRLPSGQVKISVALQNRSPEDNIWISWKAVFYDNRNFKIEETEWQKTYFPVMQIREITVNSIRKDVENFTIMLKYAGKQESRK